jgi:hypothetical protein
LPRERLMELGSVVKQMADRVSKQIGHID